MKRNQRAVLPILLLALGALCLAVDPLNLGAAITRLLGVTVRPQPTGVDAAVSPGARTFVDVSTSGPTPYHIFRLENPARLVIDLDGARFPERPRTVPGRAPLLKDVRMGQFRDLPAVARVVADLAGNPVYQVRKEAHGFSIELQSRDWIAPLPPPSPVAQASSLPTHDAAFVAQASSLPRHDAALVAQASPPSPIAQASSLPTLVAQASSLPTTEQAIAPKAEKAEIDSPQTPVAHASSLPASAVATAPAVTEQAGSLRYNPSSPDARAAAAAQVLLARAQAQGQAPPAAPSPGVVPVTPQTPAKPKLPASSGQYTGQPISVNLKDVDLKDFFRLIHEISGLNIIVDPNVSGTVTLVLDDVPWDQALDIVLKNNGLGRELDGNVLRIAKTETLAAEAENQVKLVQAQEDSAPLVTVVRPLKYARAVDTTPSLGGGSGQIGTILPIPGVVTILQKMTTLFSKRGLVVADARNNAVVITDIPKQIPIIESVIAKLDRKARQISIQARIVLTTNDFTRQFQAALNGGAFNPSNSVIGAGTVGTGSSITPNTQFTTPPPTSGRVTVVPPAAAGFGAFAISNLGARYFIDAAIAAAETRNQARTISAPTIVTQNNVPGEVLQGTQIPLQTTINNTVTTIYINATLTLDVLPQVTEDGNIFLNIRVQNNSPGPVLTGTQNPEINTQAATTQVMVPDGGTVVFGGIKVTSTTRSLTQVPGLGEIPVLGHLFKSTTREVTTNDLLFIVTPKVLPDKVS